MSLWAYPHAFDTRLLDGIMVRHYYMVLFYVIIASP